jgi:hypothetical protein
MSSATFTSTPSSSSTYFAGHHEAPPPSSSFFFVLDSLTHSPVSLTTISDRHHETKAPR